MVKYKLIKEYPGSKPLGYILKPVNNGLTKPDNYYQNGIWFNPSDYPKYWQEVKKLTLLEEAKLRYPIGTKFRSVQYDSGVKISNNNIYEETYIHLPIIYCDGTTIYYNNKWAEIVDDFVLPEIWWVRITKENLKDISKFLDFNLGEYTIGLVAGMVKSYRNSVITKGYNSTPTTSYGSTFGNEITLEQFKQYVLKEEITVKVKEKVVEKDYEILSLIEDKFIYPCDKYSKDYINQLFNTLGISIHSVKRLSDSEIFTIGDKINCNCLSKKEINNTFISNFNIINNNIRVYDNFNEFHLLKDIQKAKQPLFITEDSVDIFEGDKYFICTASLGNCINNEGIVGKFFKPNPNYKYFSTKVKAEEYILMNKPLLSLSDVWDNLKVKDQKEVLKFVKSKLNK